MTGVEGGEAASEVITVGQEGSKAVPVFLCLTFSLHVSL